MEYQEYLIGKGLELFTTVIDQIASNPEKISEAFGDMPNINLHVLDKGVFWRNVVPPYKGWKLEENTFTKHCRIISPEKIRMSWGWASKDDMIKRLQEIANAA